MQELRYTLVTEGSSDNALMPILDWALQENGVTGAIQKAWADLSWIPISERITLAVKIREAVRLYPCDLLFVHRDADRTTRQKRVDEITAAISKVVEGADDPSAHQIPPAVCIIPVQMQEAWLLIDDTAIRRAADNCNGRIPLNLPSLEQIESLANPKQILHELLKQASEKQGRRLKQFRPHAHARRVADYISDFSPLRKLPAFIAMEAELAQTIEAQGWRNH